MGMNMLLLYGSQLMNVTHEFAMRAGVMASEGLFLPILHVVQFDGTVLFFWLPLVIVGWVKLQLKKHIIRGVSSMSFNSTCSIVRPFSDFGSNYLHTNNALYYKSFLAPICAAHNNSDHFKQVYAPATNLSLCYNVRVVML